MTENVCFHYNTLYASLYLYATFTFNDGVELAGLRTNFAVLRVHPSYMDARFVSCSKHQLRINLPCSVSVGVSVEPPFVIVKHWDRFMVIMRAGIMPSDRP